MQCKDIKAGQLFKTNGRTLRRVKIANFMLPSIHSAHAAPYGITEEHVLGVNEKCELFASHPDNSAELVDELLTTV